MIEDIVCCGDRINSDVMEKEGGEVMRRGSVMEAGLLEEDGAGIKNLENKNKISVTLGDSGFLSPAPNNSICSTVACSRQVPPILIS